MDEFMMSLKSGEYTFLQEAINLQCRNTIDYQNVVLIYLKE